MAAVISEAVNSNNAPTTNPAVLPEGTKMVPLHRVVPNKNKARKYLNIQDLKRLVQIHGLTKPLTVAPAPRKLDGQTVYVIKDGERRWMAARQLGYTEIPVSVIAPLNELEAVEYQLVCNKSRRDLSVIDEAEAILKLLMGRLEQSEPEVKILLSRLGHHERDDGNKVIPEEKKIVSEVLEASGRSLSDYRQNLLPFVNHESDVREAFRAGLIGRNHARMLGNLQNHDLRGQMLNAVMDEGLTANQLRCRLDDADALQVRLNEEDLVIQQKLVESLFLKLKETWIWEDMATLADFEKNLKTWLEHEPPE